jgi:hypothetical protein
MLQLSLLLVQIGMLMTGVGLLLYGVRALAGKEKPDQKTAKSVAVTLVIIGAGLGLMGLAFPWLARLYLGF